MQFSYENNIIKIDNGDHYYTTKVKQEMFPEEIQDNYEKIIKQSFVNYSEASYNVTHEFNKNNNIFTIILNYVEKPFTPYYFEYKMNYHMKDYKDYTYERIEATNKELKLEIKELNKIVSSIKKTIEQLKIETVINKLKLEIKELKKPIEQLKIETVINKLKLEETSEKLNKIIFSIINPDEPIKYSIEEWRKYFPNAKNINISNNQNITDKDMIYLQGIHTLNMSGCMNITDIGMGYLRGINTLNISDCINITDDGLKYLNSIEILDISRCNKITDKALDNLRNIKSLIMVDCINITGEFFKNLRNINHLNMSGCVNITNENLQFDKIWINLKELNISRCPQITNIVLKQIALANQAYGNPGTRIQKLNISECIHISDMTFVTNFSNMLELNISGCPMISENQIIQLIKYTKNKIDISNCKQLTDKGLEKIFIKGASETERCKNINISNCNQITDMGLKYLIGSDQCQSCTINDTNTLNISGCTKITDIGLKYLTSHRKHNHSQDGASFETLPLIHTLNIDGCTNITDVGLNHLSHMKELSVNNCPNITKKSINKLKEIGIIFK
jgi:hypothetical protein